MLITENSVFVIGIFRQGKLRCFFFFLHEDYVRTARGLGRDTARPGRRVPACNPGKHWLTIFLLKFRKNLHRSASHRTMKNSITPRFCQVSSEVLRKGTLLKWIFLISIRDETVGSILPTNTQQVPIKCQ